jgi:hypothetical protein
MCSAGTLTSELRIGSGLGPYLFAENNKFYWIKWKACCHAFFVILHFLSSYTHFKLCNVQYKAIKHFWEWFTSNLFDQTISKKEQNHSS